MPHATFSDNVFPFGQQITIRFNTNFEQILRTAMALRVRPIEIRRGPMQGGMDDPALLARIQSPVGLLQAQADMGRRQSERAVEALKAMAAELTKSLGETAQFVWRASAWR